MSGGSSAVMAMQSEDVSKILAAQAHLGSRNLDHQMGKYIYKRRSDGVHIMNIHHMWQKMQMAARILVAIENPADITVIGETKYAQRAILKFCSHIGANPIAGRFTPGTFTNQIQRAFCEPRILIITDTRIDSQAVREASYVNIPIIALTNSDSPLKNVDLAIPCNNQNKHSLGLIYWFLAREVLRLRGQISRSSAWEVMPDLYFYRDPEDLEKEEKEAQAKREALEAAANTTDEVAQPGFGAFADAGGAADFQMAQSMGVPSFEAAPAAAAGEWPTGPVAPSGNWEGQAAAATMPSF